MRFEMECYTHEKTDNQTKHLEISSSIQMMNKWNKKKNAKNVELLGFHILSAFAIVTQIDVSISLNDDFKSIILYEICIRIIRTVCI